MRNILLKNTMQYFCICALALVIVSIPQLGFCAGSNPFNSIQTNLESSYTSFVKIVQIFGAIALLLYGGYSFFQGQLDKMRLLVMIFGLVLIGLAKPIVSFIVGWGS